jgi:oligopeptide transport system substrate-binding protein
MLHSIFALILLLLTGCRSSESYKSLEQLESSNQSVQIALTNEPSTLDPRLARDLGSATLLHMLYEGLMRIDYDGKIIPGLAKEVQVSPDHKTYTFKLRPSVWSNGDALTAHTFVETWRSLLDPHFPAPNAYQFYLIKGAKEAKLGQLPLDEIGIQAIDNETLTVELETATPYFLQLLATHFFFPVHPHSKGEAPIGNGPFMLKSWQPNSSLSFIKNEQFWDAPEVHLRFIKINILDEHTALTLFENRELSWVGSPMGTIPQDAVATLQHRRQLHILPAAGTHWLRYNTAKAPFQNVQMRRALALAIDRKALVTHVTQGNQRPALAIVPPSFGLSPHAFFEDHNSPMAWEAFQKGLDALNISKDELAPIVLSFPVNDRNQKLAQALQQQWSKGLGIQVTLLGEETKVFLDRVKRGDYQIALGSWYADVHDPANFLDLFKSKNNPTNLTQWEDPQYSSLLEESANEQDLHKRLVLLGQAEELLMQEMPIAPLFFGAFNYVKKPNLVGVHFSDLGTLDFTYAFNEE